MNRNMPAREAALTVFDAYRTPLKRFDADAFKSRDIEQLHKFRVALRRSRALLKGMSGVYSSDQIKYFYARLRDLQRITNLVREIDVLILTLPELVTYLPATSKTGVELLVNWLTSKQEHAWLELAEELQRAAYSEILNEWFAVLDGTYPPSFAEQADTPILDHACQTLSKSMSRLIRDAWSIDENTPLPDLHKTRIRVKVMRYQLEAYLPIMDKGETIIVRDRLKLIQDKLGEMNDCHTAIRFLTHHRNEVLVAAGEKSANVLDDLIELLADRFTRRRSQAIQSLHDFANELGIHSDRPPCKSHNTSGNR